MRALGIGELVWDLLPSGPRLGGAPFNVVAHLAKLGCDAALFSAVGRDELGARTLDEVRRLSVSTAFIQVVDVPTGVVRVQLDRFGAPEYEIVSPAAYEYLSPGDQVGASGQLDIVVFGTLAQRSPGTLATTQKIAQTERPAVRLYDVNLRPGRWSPSLVEVLLGLATVVKMNDAEAVILAKELSLARESTAAFSMAMATRYGLRGVCVTRGADGAALLYNGTYREAQAVPIVVADTVGTGDAFAAGLAFGITTGLDVETVLELGSRLASLVASRPGALPDWDLSELGMEFPMPPIRSREPAGASPAGGSIADISRIPSEVNTRRGEPSPPTPDETPRLQQ